MNEKEMVCSNAQAVTYEADGVKIDLDGKAVRNYIVRGNAGYVTDAEVALFINTCMAQKLNPFVNGEVYLIKYTKDQPAQMVVGKEFYMKRAYENPAFRAMKSGIVVATKGGITRKEGTCVYPGEELIGGWCTIYYERGGKEYETYKEVSMAEYSSGKSSWTTKPATMIAKVAISQCARDAFPSDFEGLYSVDEMVAAGAIDSEYVSDDVTVTGEEVVEVKTEEPAEKPAEESAEEPELPFEEERKVTKEERQRLFAAVQNIYGREDGNNILKVELEKLGIERSADLTISQYDAIMKHVDALA